ncbi:MAG: DNA polymerase III subunit delta [Syntrophobacteraceae bacterium]
MQAEEFLKRIELNKFEPVYLFLGDAAFPMEEAWKKMVAGALSKGSKSFNGDRTASKEISAGQVIERLATTPMFGGRRLFMVENVEAWGKDDQAMLESFIPRIPPSACLVLTALGKKPVEGLAKAVEAKGAVVQFRQPGAKEAPRWLMERARESGKILDYRAAFLLVEIAGEDFHTLSSELEKICTFVGEKEAIEAEDILEAASSQRNFTMFDLLDQVKARQPGKAIKSLRSLIAAGAAPLVILSTLAWQIRVIWQIKDGLHLGISEAELVQRLKLHAFVVKKAREQAARFSDGDLYRILSAIGQTDVAIKSSGTPPEAQLEALVVELCLDRKSPRV